MNTDRIDLNIEGTGEVSGWSPPIGEVLSPGFKATMISLYEAGAWLRDNQVTDTVKLTNIFVNKLADKGYCIAKYSPDK